MVKRIVPGALALALTLTLAGCPGGKDPKPDSGGLTLADFCATGPDMMSVVVGCLHGDPASVSSISRAGCAQMEAEVAKGRLAYDADRAKACVDTWKTMTCDLEVLDAGVPACMGVLVGKVANGGACLNDLECAEGQCLVGASCPGVCTAFVGLGGDCSAAGAACAQGLVCDLSARCVVDPVFPLAQRGQPCTGGCVSGFYCDPGTKTCAPKKRSGSCAGAPDACAFAYACVESGTCVAYAGRGERCGRDAQCGTGWACVEGTCGPPPAIGSPCGSSHGIECAEGAYCDSAGTPTCRALKAAGAACHSSAECESYSCKAGKCEIEVPTCTVP